MAARRGARLGQSWCGAPLVAALPVRGIRAFSALLSRTSLRIVPSLTPSTFMAHAAPTSPARTPGVVGVEHRGDKPIVDDHGQQVVDEARHRGFATGRFRRSLMRTSRSIAMASVSCPGDLAALTPRHSRMG